MKKIYTLTLSTGLALALVGCSASNEAAPAKSSAKASDTYTMDVAQVCDASTKGAQAVLDIAKTYNPIAKKQGLEFRRHGMDNSLLIEETQLAIDTKASEVKLLDDRKKKTLDGKLKKEGKSAKDMDPAEYKKGYTTKVSMTVNDAATRACKFATAALIQQHEAETSYRLAIPGDGYQY
jgi:PBP1b-binding outer membrane lipoprotein LpoB